MQILSTPNTRSRAARAMAMSTEFGKHTKHVVDKSFLALVTSLLTGSMLAIIDALCLILHCSVSMISIGNEVLKSHLADDKTIPTVLACLYDIAYHASRLTDSIPRSLLQLGRKHVISATGPHRSILPPPPFVPMALR
jgi:hypothetical protein